MPPPNKISPFIKFVFVVKFKIFNIINFNYYKFLRNSYLTHLSQPKNSRLFMRSHEYGIMLVEVILTALFLTSIAIATPYFFAQNQAVMKSSSQTMGCQNIARQALINTVSLGARLYAYKINHSDHSKNGLGYNPLFIKKNGSAVDDVGDGSELSFPPKMYKTLYKDIGITPVIQDPKTNTGKALIGSTYPLDLSTSVLLVNSVNALQYLYNFDNGFFTENSGMGKMYTIDGINPMDDESELSSLWEKYKDRFDLEDIKFYIKIAPIDLTTNEEMSSPPSKILTRPRFHNPKGVSITPDLNILGDENIGFETTVMLKYTRNDQEYTCQAKQRFYHQGKTITKKVEPLPIDLTILKTGADIDLKNNADLNTPALTPAVPSDLKMVSCDTHGSGYRDINLTIDFSGMGEGQQVGTVILCRMSSYCRSYGYNSYRNCFSEFGQWQRCHNITPAGNQSWTYSVNPTNNQTLEMTFNDMKFNRRYELDVGEFSIAGLNLRFKTVAKFYIDAKRPEINSRRVTNNLVGIPIDAQEDRNYGHPHPPTAWKQPPNSFRRWLQCKTGTVEFAADLTDQFVHNLYRCNITGKREDGTNKGTGVATSPTQTSDCAGELSVAQHGRYTITFAGGDTCGTNALSTKDLVWDADLPSTFAPQGFTQDPEWLYSSDKDAYPIDTEIPSATTAGKFPKHYSVDCDDNYQGTASRQDGDGEKLECRLSGSVSDHDDGCNLSPMGIKYYHACGEAQVGCNHSKKKKWGVYAPHGESCVNVWCELSLSCCDASSGTCNGVSDNECGNAQTRHCTNPKGGTQTSADETLSGCPALGLNDCSYQLPCEATSPCSETGPTSACNGTRQGGSCSYTRPRTCIPNDTGLNSSCNTSGSWTTGCASGTCTVGCVSVCTQPCTHWTTCQNTCSGTDSKGNPTTYPCGPTYSCLEHGCHEYKQRAVSTSMSDLTFSGSCGYWSSGGCSKKGVGGGNSSQERCNQRTPLCCDRTTTCCPGDTHLTNSNCPPPPPPPPPGTPSPSGGGGGCDSNTTCCSGNTHPSNPNCTPLPPCDSTKRCCHGDTPQSNSKCGSKKVNGKCNKNGCSAGRKNGSGDSWSCLGEGGGSDVNCAKPCNTNTECCDGQGQCGTGGGGGGGTKIVGKCGSSKNDCSAGNLNHHPPHSSTEYKWTCRSIPHTQPNREVQCSKAIVTPTTNPTINNPNGVDAICNNGQCGGCSTPGHNSGSAVSCSSSGNCEWTCHGKGNGKDKDCSGFFPSENGQGSCT